MEWQWNSNPAIFNGNLSRSRNCVQTSIEYFQISDDLPIESFIGVILLITGIWTKLTSKNYYIDKEGRRKYIEIENDLFFIKMNTWDYC